MNREQKRILLVEDDEAHAQLIGRAFENHEERFSLSVARNLGAARKMIAEREHHLIITDLYLPDGSGSALLPPDGQEPEYPIVVMTSYGNEKLAVEAMKGGALDYVVKSDATLNDMAHIAERALREWNHIKERKKLENQIRQAQKMEAVGTLAGGIAHDFNNLLMGIQGNTSLMLIDMDSDHPHFERLKNIEQFVKSGAELTQQLLGFARGGKF
jgi:DNA-binding NtrC family response regulator